MTTFLEMDESIAVEKETLGHFARGMKTLFVLTSTEHKSILGAGALLVLVELLGLGITLSFSQLLNDIEQIQTAGFTMPIVLLIVGMFAFRLLAIFIRRIIKEPMFLKALVRLENAWPVTAQSKLLALSLQFHNQENTGRKIAKVNKGIEKLVNLMCDLYWGLLPTLIYTVVNLLILLVLDWRLALLFTVPLFLVGWINMRAYRRFRPQWEEWEKHKEESIGLFCQSIINVRTVQSFVRESAEQGKNASVRADMCTLDTKICLDIQRYHMIMELILGFAFIGTVVAGLYFVSQGWTAVGTVAYLFITGNIVVQNLVGMVQHYTRISRDIVAAERMQHLLETEVEVQNTHPNVIPEVQSGELAFNKVSLAYPGKAEPTIRDLSLSIARGEMCALVGPSGAGKSTIVSLLARMQDVTAGSITLDGVDIRAIDRDWYRKRFAFVLQDVEIFDGTIRENILYARDTVPDALLDRATAAACLTEVLSDTKRFPDGLETQVGERGLQLSGGERQRVGIARAYLALLSGAEVLILDEATSSLDSASERIVQNFIDDLRSTQEITIVSIAHRLSTISRADTICVINDGTLVERGTHEELLKGGGIYANLVHLQTMGE